MIEPRVMSLRGCRPRPLASYLKALGVFRLMAEQFEPEVRGWWEADTFRIESGLGLEELRTLLLERYAPTPILGPWNGGSGFYPKDSMGKEVLGAILDGGAVRLAQVRDTIRLLQEEIKRRGYEQRPEKAQKLAFVNDLRAIARGGFLRWIDAAIALGTEDLLYPPLLGTGGNDGRLDFTVNFFENVLRVMDPHDGTSRTGARDLLDAALFSAPVPGLSSSAIGQFAPGAAGGPNASTGFGASPSMNPWDFVLMMEGAVLFSTSTVRRLEALGSATLAYPFTVRTTGAGGPGTAPEDAVSARAEVWLPLWSSRCSLVELRRILSEGRLIVGRRSARDGLDVARAISSLGVDRGIDSLERYGFMQRSGNAYLATPLGRVAVRRRPEVQLIDDLDRGRWLDRFRRLAGDRSAPARLTSLGHRLEDALFDLARSDNAGGPAHRALIVLGEILLYLAASPKAREQCPPVPRLSPRWRDVADDGSPAFSLAAGLAGMHGRREGREVLSVVEYLAPVTTFGRNRLSWAAGTANRVVWGSGAVTSNLGRMARRALLEHRAGGLEDLTRSAHVQAPLSVVLTWMTTPAWDARVRRLLPGLALVRSSATGHGNQPDQVVPIPATFGLLKPFFTPGGRVKASLRGLRGAGENGLAERGVPPPDQIIRLLMADEIARALSVARRQLRGRGLVCPYPAPPAGNVTGPRLLAALLVPLERRGTRRVLSTFFPQDSTQSVTSIEQKEG